MFKSKRLSLLTIFALLLPTSAGIATFGSSAAMATTTSLATFTVNGTDVVDGSVVSLPNGTTSVTVVALADDPTSTVSVVGDTGLVTGSNTLTATVTDVDTFAQAYTVTLNVLPSSNTDATVTIDGAAASESVATQVPYGTTSVAVAVTLADATASYIVSGASGLVLGNNTVTVAVTAADGTTARTYSYTVTVLPSTNTGASVYINGAEASETQDVEVEYGTTSVTVEVTLADANASYVVTGGSGLTTGDNSVLVAVTAADGTTIRNYGFNVRVLPNTDATASISVNGTDVIDGDDFEVVWGTQSVTVVVTPTDSNATYFLNGDLGLVTGDNALLVTVTAADGVTTLDYNINIRVLQNTDTTVNSITVNGTAVTDGSTVDLDPLTTEVGVEVDTTDVDATYVVSGDTDLQPGVNDLTVTVIAADGLTSQDYYITLNVALNTDVSVSSLQIAGVDAADGDYVTVDPGTTEVSVVVETTDPNASYEVVGGTDLVPGENQVDVVVTAADNETSATITVIVVVAPSTDASIESINVNGETYQDGDVVYLPPFTEAIDLEVVTTDPDATYIVDGDTGLSVGDNTLTVIVTAADGLTSQDYLVTLVVAASNNAEVDMINVTFAGPDGDQTVEVVDGDTLDLPSNTSSVDIEVTTNDGEATYEVTGATDLTVGENPVTITVTAPDGETTQDIYITLNVAVGDVTTSSFTVNGQEVSGGDVVDLDPGTESVDVAVVTTDPNATYELTGGDNLVLGSNTLTLTVTSVDETLTVEYSVTLTVLPSSDAGITGIQVNGIDWVDGTPVEVDAGDLDVQVATANEFATVAIAGSTTNVSGIQELTVTVTAQDGETTQDATIQVIASSDVEIVPASALSDGQLRVDSWIKLPRAQFETGVKLAYSWIRDLDSSAVGTGYKYKLTTDDYGHDVRAVIVVTKKGQPDRLILSRKIEVAAGVIAKAPTPTLKGKAAVGNTLTAATRAWPDGVELAYQWYRDGEAVEGANSETYDLTADDLGAAITVGITGTMEAYEPLEKVSNPLTVAAGKLVYSEKPTISGDFVTGGTIEVNPGAWLDGAEVSIAWLRDGEEFNVTAADENSYVLTSEDYGTKIGVQIRVTAPGYNDAVFNIKGRAIKVGTLAEPPVPTISGSGLVGETLDADAGEYPEGATFTYVWKRDGRVISGANESSYTVTARDNGKTITVKVIARIPGYKVVRVESTDGIQAMLAE